MKYTKEELQNTYGEVQSLEHAEYIAELCESNGIELFNFYSDDVTHFMIKHGQVRFTRGGLRPKHSNCKLITIPLPPKESVIEWKEGAVCFSGGESHSPSRAGFVVDSRGFETSFLDIMDYRDFQLNTIKQGDYVSAASISTKSTFDKMVEVFGLFGYKFEHNSDAVFSSIRSEQCIYAADFGLMFYGSKNGKGRELSVNQVEFIGELKRLGLKGGNAALSSDEETELKSRAMASELNSQSNDDEWPKVGDEFINKGEIVTCISKGVISDGSEVITFEFADRISHGSCWNNDTWVKKPKTPEDLLIEELQTKLLKNNAVDNWMLSANIISGDIEGLTYKSDIESAVKSVINKNLDGDL